jgi:predicted amidohydrolase YtcJ
LPIRNTLARFLCCASWMSPFPVLSTAAAVAGAGAGATSAKGADMILAHGRIYTLDEAAPWAQAVAISNGRIAAVGTDDEVMRHKTAATRVIDLHGHLLTPGLIDSHVHFVDGGWYLKNVALRDATTMAEVSRRVAKYVTTHAQADWIQGEGWSYGYSDLPGGEYRKEIIDRISGAHPVFLDSSMAHAAWVNSEALRRAGITRDTPNPSGGQIVRDASGEPTGWLKEEAAIKLVLDKIPAPGTADTKGALVAAIREANRLGLTRVDSAGGDFPLLPLLDQLRREGRLTLRVSRR